MTHISRNRVLLGAVFSALVSVVGCTGTTTMSSYARPGDTVMMAFGPLSATPLLRQQDLVAQITDFSGAIKTARLRQVVNVYPDPASPVAAEMGGTLNLTGERSAVIDLVDSNGNALSLAAGAATLKLWSGTTVVATSGLQILGGGLTGTPNPLNAYVASATARSQVRFRIQPTTTTYNQVLSAVEFELHYDPAVLTGPETSWPQAVPTMQDANVQFSTRYYQQDAATEVIKVMMVNPDGIIRIFGAPATPVPAYNFYRGKSTYDMLAFSVVWGDATLQTSYPTPTINSSVIASATTILKVFDLNGADVSSNFTVAQE